MQLGWALLFLGGPRNALAHGEKSLRLSPRDPNIFWRYELLGWCQLMSNDVDEAIDLFIKARTANPRVWNFSYELAGALGLKGDLEGGKAALADSLKLKPEVNSLAQWYAFLPWTSKTSAPEILGAAGHDTERGPASHRLPGRMSGVARERAFADRGMGDPRWRVTRRHSRYRNAPPCADPSPPMWRVTRG
jgi:tetratricopeptide (TPR) repeat protein